MIVAGSASPLLLASAAGGYNLERSVRFRSAGAASLFRTPSTASNRKTFTFSAWIKRGLLDSNQREILSSGTSGQPRSALEFNTSGQLYVAFNADGSTWTELITTAIYRDPSAWYHIVVAVDTTQATDTNRIKVYVNGTQVTSFSSSGYPAQNTDLPINNNIIHGIGRYTPSNQFFFDGYMAEINFIDGQALPSTSFGEFSSKTGVWQPKKYAGTYGTNGYYLNFTDNSSLTTSSNVGLGKDFSGNGNYFATNNISLTAGATYDSMTDVPTLTSATAANFAVINPLDSNAVITGSNQVISNGNLRMLNTNATHSITRATVGSSSGKFYWEIKVDGFTNFYSGAYKTDASLNSVATVGADSNSWAYVASTGEKRYNGTSSAYGSALASGSVLGCALDLDSGKIWWSVDGTFQASGDPAAGTNPAFTGVTGNITAAAGCYDTQINYNFGQQPFVYTPPTGFVALNTFNLPTPTIGATASTLANKNMDVSLYTGNNTTNVITNSGGMQPDFVWIKNRNSDQSHTLVDVVRGTTKQLNSNDTAAEGTNSAGRGLQSFNSNGFTLGIESSAAGGTNASGFTYVGWQWKGGGTGVSNTAGSITSTVSANTSAGFSVVTYTGTGSNATVGHGLGVAPRMIIVKDRTSDINWRVYHASLGATQNLNLNTTSAASTQSVVWNDTAPTSTVFSLGTASGVNANTDNYVAYCFSEIAGYSKMGSYTGNGSPDGTFVFTGFRPRFVMFKLSSGAGESWEMYDTARGPYNILTPDLYANLSNAETTNSNRCDILSNGIKFRTPNGGVNGSGSTYIYMAFAESPFKYANAR